MKIAMLRRGTMALVLASPSMILSPVPPASAHGVCTPSASVRIFYDPSPASVVEALANLYCDSTHYIIQGRVKLQQHYSGSWHTIRDSGTVSDCCDHRQVPGFGFNTQPFGACVGPATWRSYIVYIETISRTGNVAHRYTSLASAPYRTDCL